MRTNRRTFAAAEIVPESLLAPLDLAGVFEREGPLEVDLGCGDGTFLVALAQQNPDRNFLGVEQLAGRIRAACRKIGDQEVENARILSGDILHVIQHLLPRSSVDVFHLMFPDPWPKRRHHERRVFSISFLQAITRALKPEGRLLVATDNRAYSAAIEGLLDQLPPSLRRDAEYDAELPASTFEERFRQSGAQIYRSALRKVSAPR